ncbi:MAG: pitrilysin family protein [bacterium]
MESSNWIFKYKWIILSFGLSFFSLIFLSACNREKKQFKSKVKVECFMNNNLKKVVLDNGLTVLVFKNTQTPKVLLQIAYDVGSYIEQDGERGMAHLIEHMIFKGTEKMSEGDIDSIARKYGADFNAFTGKDMTSYYFEVDKNNWQPFVGILADCMQNARFDEQHLASEFRAVIQELKMYSDKYWNVMLELAAKNIFPSNHPYHNPIIGFKQDLVNIKASDLKGFYKRYYRPERATLFMVGDIEPDEAIEMAIKTFGDIPDGKQHVDVDQVDSMFDILPNTIINETKIYEDVKKEQLGFYWLIPGVKSKMEELFSVIEFILGKGEGSRLHKRLVEKEKVASSVGCMSYQLMESGMFLIFVEPMEGKAVECRKFIIEELTEIIKNGVLFDELQKVIRTKEYEFYQQFQSLSSFTYEWIKSFIATKDELDIFNKVKIFEQIDIIDVQKIIKNYLDPFFINQIELVPLPEDKKDFGLRLKEKSDQLDRLILEKHPRTALLEEPRFVKNLPEPNKLEFEFPKPAKDFDLDNGLNILLFKNKNWPIFSLNLRFNQAEELVECKDGILLDFMMNFLMEGTAGFSKEENVDFFEQNGAAYSFEVSGAGVSGLVKNHKEVIDRFFRILIQPTFPSSELQKQKDIFIDLFKRRNDSQTDKGVRDLKNLIYKDHPYEWTFDQAIELIESVDIKKLKELHKKYVTPKNMILAFAGDFNLQEAELEIRKIFGAWTGEQYLMDVLLKGDFKPGESIDTFMLRDQVLLLLGRPSTLNVYNKDLIPVKILNFIAFNSIGSRLYQLREQTGLFYTAFGGLAAGAARVNGFDYVGSILNLENIEKAEKLMLDVIDNLGKNGVHEYELDASRQSYLKGIIDLTSSNEMLVAVFARLKSLELDFDYYDKVLQTVQSISLQEINKISAKYFDSNDMSRVRVGRVSVKS